MGIHPGPDETLHSEVGRADGTHVLNRRIVPLAVGAVGAALGVVAVATSTVVVGLVAGITALLAGALALTLEDPDTTYRRISEAQTAERLQEAELNTARGELSEARQRIAALDEEVRRLTEAAPSAAAPGDPGVLTDPETELFSEAYFHVALDARIASARRHLRPVAIALIEVHEGTGPGASLPAPPERAAESIRETIRDADTACRLSDGAFAVILEDTPENGAVWTVERVRRNLVSRFGNHTMWAGVACYPAHAFSATELLDQARVALGSAREWRQDRIEVAIAE